MKTRRRIHVEKYDSHMKIHNKTHNYLSLSSSDGS